MENEGNYIHLAEGYVEKTYPYLSLGPRSIGTILGPINLAL